MCYLLKKYFLRLLRGVTDLRSTACKHYRKWGVTYRYLHIKLIWYLSMVQYLQNNVMKWTTRFTSFDGWIPLKYGSTTTPPIIAHCQNFPMLSLGISHCDHPKPPIKDAPRFWPSPRRIFKTSLYYETGLILKNWRYLLVLPFDTKNPYRLSKLLYRSIIDISTSWHLILAIVPVV